MADVNVGSSQWFIQAFAFWGHAHFFVDHDIGYELRIDTTDDLQLEKTTDQGANWSLVSELDAGTVRRAALWYDRWTAEDTGTEAYVWWIDDTLDRLNFQSFDTADDSLGTRVTVVGSLAVTTTHSMQHGISGCKARNGDLGVLLNENTTTAFYISDDAGATWSAATSPLEDSTDQAVLLPGLAGGDFRCLYHDRSAGEVTLKSYDAGLGSWSEGNVLVTISTASSDYNHIDAVERHSDGDILAVIWNESVSATGDLELWNATDETDLGDVLTDTNARAVARLYIDQNTDDLYVGYLEDQGGGNHLAHLVKSDDGGATWGLATDLGDGVNADDYRNLTLGYCCPSGQDGLISGLWTDCDDSILYFGVDGTVEINAAAGSVAPIAHAFMGGR